MALSRSDCTDDVLTLALGLAGEAPCRLVLLHVVEPLAESQSCELPVGASGPSSVSSTLGTKGRKGFPLTRVDALVESAERWLTPFARRAREAAHQVHMRVEYGDVVESILDVAKEQRAAYLVLGTRRRRGLALLLLGSTVRAVSKRARCEVRLARHSWKPSCRAPSCQWCEDRPDPLRARLEVEAEG